MKFTLLGNRPATWPAIVLVLALFVAVGCWWHSNATGEDLASSYVGSRLLAEDLPSHLFSYDPASFDEIGDDDTWTVVAQQGSFYGFLHPYVQTPLWAYLLEPLCRRVSFNTFAAISRLLILVCFAGTLWLTARYWARSFFNPYAMAVVVLALGCSQPFQYAMFLDQTHILLVFPMLAALVLAEKDQAVAAGFLLAFAAAVKITPGLLIFYWLLTGRWKAALSAVIWSGVLWAGTVLAVGHALTGEYLANVHRISHVLLLSQNNQSLAAWIMQHFYSFDEVFNIRILDLPTPVRLLSLVLMLGFTGWGGWIDRSERRNTSGFQPVGAMMAIVAATVFAPIAWTHYAIVLLMPCMMLIDRSRRFGPPWMYVLLAAILLLNYRPIATDIDHGLIGPYSVVRGQFFACVLTLLALPLSVWNQRRARNPRPSEDPLSMKAAAA